MNNFKPGQLIMLEYGFVELLRPWPLSPMSPFLTHCYLGNTTPVMFYENIFREGCAEESFIVFHDGLLWYVERGLYNHKLNSSFVIEKVSYERVQPWKVVDGNSILKHHV